MKRLLLSAIYLAASGAARADDIAVAVAANFTEPMKKIAASFEKKTGHKLLSTFGATGKFYAQIKAGAPFQLLLAADEETPARLEQEGKAIAGSRFTYAIGKLVLWSAKDAVVDGTGTVLKRGGFEHLALANPKLAPYGAAAVDTLKRLGVYDALAPKFVQGENIAQTYQFVATGNALLGFVALSQVIGEDGRLKSGSMWVVPEKYYAPIRQDAVLLDKGRDNAAAQTLLGYLRGSEARQVIQAYGYALEPQSP